MLSMLGFIDQTFKTHDVHCINYTSGDYTDDGVWADGGTEEFDAGVNLQPVDRNAVEFLTGNGGTVDIQNAFNMHLNNGKQVYHGRQTLNGVIKPSIVMVNYQGEMRKFKVIYADNQPHHNFCQAYIEMMKDA